MVLPKNLDVPKLFEKVKVFNLETRKMLFLQKKFNIKLVPIVLVLPREAFNKMGKRESLCNGTYFGAGKFRVFPFNKVGFCVIAEQPRKDLTLITAWHEIRHHIYAIRAVPALSPLDNAILSQLFAYIANAHSYGWLHIAKLLKEEFASDFDPTKQKILSGNKLSWFQTIGKVCGHLHFLYLYHQQAFLDEIILRCKSLKQLEFRLARLSERILKTKKAPLVESYFLELTQEHYFHPHEVAYQLRQLGIDGFIEWAEKKIQAKERKK